MGVVSESQGDPEVDLDPKEQEARIGKLIAETRYTEIQSSLYPIVITSGFFLGVAAIIKIFL